jgi:hypothetical protein
MIVAITIVGFVVVCCMLVASEFRASGYEQQVDQPVDQSVTDQNIQTSDQTVQQNIPPPQLYPVLRV